MLLATTVVSPPAEAQRRYGGGEQDPQPQKATLAIVGGMLIDGHEGRPVPHSLILIDGSRIVAVGTRDTLKVPPGTRVLDASGMTVMPGLIDVHVHMDTLGHTDYQHWHQTYRSRLQEIYDVASRQLLTYGVTTAVDLGGYTPEIQNFKKRIAAGQVVAPRLKFAMGFISNYADSFIPTWHRGYQTVNVHTVDDARAAALKWIEAGADVLKAYDGLTGDQVTVIAEEARKKGLWVTGHVSNPENAIARVQAGQDAIEHTGGLSYGSTVPPELIRVLLQRRTIIVPTMLISTVQLDAVDWPEFWTDNQRATSTTPPDIWADIRASLEHPERVLTNLGGFVRRDSVERSRAIFKQLREAGIPMLIGTDSSTPLNLKTDAVWREMEQFVLNGVPPMEVIGLATRRNAEYIKMGPDLGTVTRGKFADIIIVDGNPLANIRDLRNVVAVVKDGKIYREPTVSPTATSNAATVAKNPR
ncbi:MAG: amidohydrolase family protein [Acidobacteria bacterium]|nr:amidohydrolase family protein [Acidobacteriota bacterium]